jgi:hypothetical protein
MCSGSNTRRGPSQGSCSPKPPSRLQHVRLGMLGLTTNCSDTAGRTSGLRTPSTDTACTTRRKGGRFVPARTDSELSVTFSSLHKGRNTINMIRAILSVLFHMHGYENDGTRVTCHRCPCATPSIAFPMKCMSMVLPVSSVTHCACPTPSVSKNTDTDEDATQTNTPPLTQKGAQRLTT